MLRTVIIVFAASLIALAPAQARDSELTVAEFLEIWGKIDSAGLQKAMEETGGDVDMDKFPNAKRAADEMGSVAKAYRAKHNADKAAGLATQSCLPDGEAQLNSGTLLAHLDSYDLGKRTEITLARAFADLMAKTYPCG